MSSMKRNLILGAALVALTQLAGCATYPQQGGYGSYPSQQAYGSYGSYTPQSTQPAEDVQYVNAPVISATPDYEQVQVARPRQECAQVPADTRGEQTAGTLIGGALGGLVGNQFGRGSGNAAMTALGAVAGAMAGNSVASQNQGRLVTRCRTVNDYVMQRQANGYKVRYRLNGQVYTTHTASDPGSTIRVRVGVTPQ